MVGIILTIRKVFAFELNGSCSYVSLENHIRFTGWQKEGEVLHATTQVLTGTGNKMHLFHRMFSTEDNLVVTSDTKLVHMDIAARKSTLPEPHVTERLAEFADRNSKKDILDGASRPVGAHLK